MNRSRLLRGAAVATLALATLAAAFPAPAHAQRAAPASASRTTARQRGLAPAPFHLLIYVTDKSGTPLTAVTPTADPLYPGWCDLYDFSGGAANTATPGKGAAQVSLGGINLDKAVDETSVLFFKMLLSGTASNLTLVVVRDTPDRIESWKIKCTGVHITSQQMSAASGGIALESVSIAFTAIEWDYLDTDATGKVLSQLYTAYDTSTGIATSGSRAAVYPGGADTDGDGLPDGWEFYYGLTRNSPIDVDGDGQTNLQEFLAGTVPTDPRSALRTTTVKGSVNAGMTTVTVTWQSVANKTYIVESATNPGGPWTTAATVSSAGDGTTMQTITHVNGAPFFYRVRVSP